MDTQAEMERLLHRRNGRWRRSLYLFILVPQIFILGAFFTLFSIAVYQDGLSQALEYVKPDEASEPLLVLGIMLGLLAFQVLFCREPLNELKRLEEKANLMLECFCRLSGAEQIYVLEEAKDTCKGVFSQGRFSFGRECFCATGVSVDSKIHMTYPVVLPYDKIAKVWCDSPSTMKKKDLRTIGTFALSVPVLLSGAGMAIMYMPDTPLLLLDTNGNLYSLVCGPKVAEEYALTIVNNCPGAKFGIKQDNF